MIRKVFTMLALALVLVACKDKTPPKKEVMEPEKTEPIEQPELSRFTDSVQNLYQSFGLVEVTDPRIIVDLRYTTDNNFMGMVLYDTLDRLMLQQDVSERLSLCQDLLDSLHPGYRLKVFDGVRPLQVQREMWEALDSIPPLNRGKFVSNPVFGSVHNFGTAVDITICDSLGNELDMGAGYDDFRPIAFPSREAYFLKTGELTREQWESRKLLRRIMRSQRFSNIPSEWWHFNAFSRSTCEAKFEILLDESGNHQWWVSPKILRDSSENSGDTLQSQLD
ncbi:M15 family metallopeptidase [Crocinitomicaceae bacterium]|nr:M15 family metallopeptidase [Crocinitomicaceae bacterium]